MASKVFRTPVELKNYMQVLCDKAINDTAEEAKKQLTKCIDEQYYKDSDFYPNVYERTETFLNSAACQLLSNNSAEIYIDIEGMHYKNNFNAMQVVTWASNSQHGADYYQTSTPDFWSTYIEWCNKSLISLLRKNLKAVGLISK
nr:MAG TPA: hypothetical protein [Caudoviricetes sp.]